MISFLIRHFGWRRENFRKEKIPAVFGLYIITYGVVGAILAKYTTWDSDPAAQLYLIAILGFGTLGFADDVFGNRDVGGFKGHFKKLLLEGKLTTGATKAIGGGLLSIFLAWRTSSGHIGFWVLDAAIIALAANTINLLDLRPGRALFAFFLGIGIAAILAWGHISAPTVIFTIALAAVAVACYDCRGRAMLGDVGSNTLGAVLGLSFALDASPTSKITAALLFFAINVYSERCSISKLIERHPLLARIDSKLGVR
jgi:UDP-N-acetylmuramyl pentapeptide phosphotransferase/UDP-N-acetylglucosamine-1-phosphate transferase